MCYTPMPVKERYKNIQGVLEEQRYHDCGKCPDCIKKIISGWSFRLLREGLVSESAYFLTLTYDTDYVPITTKGFMSLAKADLQKFFKRVRISHVRQGCDRTIKYFAVGEYGSNRWRPHYHIIIFNVDLELMMSRTDYKVLNYTDYDGKAHVRFFHWIAGTATVGKVSGASIGYCFKYLSKQCRVPVHVNDDRLSEFRLMSKGLGASYITESVKAWHNASPDRMYLNIDGNRKISMPRYYKARIYTEEQRAIVSDFYRAEAEIKSKEAWEQYDAMVDYDHHLAIDYAFQRMFYSSNSDKGRL